MGGQHGISGTYHEPLPPVADYNVTGSLNPDLTCNYFFWDIESGKNRYLRQDEKAELFWEPTQDSWQIHPLPYDSEGPHWQRNDPNIVGEYLPQLSAAGIATVSAGPH
jgi:hypothetical protein